MLRLPKLALVSLTVAAALRLAAGDAYTPTHPPLAQGKTKFLGSCYSAAQATDFLAYFNQVTPENAGKWGSVEATRDVMNWTELDTAYQLAKTNNLKFRFHILVWGSQQPSWISSLSTAEKLDEFKEWYAAVAARYPDIDYRRSLMSRCTLRRTARPSPSRRPRPLTMPMPLRGAGTSGWDRVIEAFKLARQYFPGKKLVLNEYGVLNDAANMAKYVAIVNLLKAQNLVDVVAVQATPSRPSPTQLHTLAANLETLAATGLPIMITEMDIDDTTAAPQLADYQRIFPLLWEHPSVTGITLWGFRPGMWRGDQGANLVNADGTEKPAMVWLKEYVRNNLPVVTAGQSFAISPTSATGATVGTVLATDADSGAVLQDWSIVGGNGASVFAINAGTGVLTVANGASLNFTANPTYTVQVKVGDGIGHSVAAAVTISAGNQPAFTTSPAATTVALGGNVTFTAAASGSPTFQWQYSHDNATFADIAGANAATYTISGAAYSASGYYRVVATNSYGSATSAAASLAVLPALSPRCAPTATALPPPAAAPVRRRLPRPPLPSSRRLSPAALARSPSPARSTSARSPSPRTPRSRGRRQRRAHRHGAHRQRRLQCRGARPHALQRQRQRRSRSPAPRTSSSPAARSSTAPTTRSGSPTPPTRDRLLVRVRRELRLRRPPVQRPDRCGRSESQAMKISLHHNWWTSHIDQRMPLAVYGQVHFYNNFVEAAANTSGTVADNQTQLLNERNAYEGVNSPLTKQQSQHRARRREDPDSGHALHRLHRHRGPMPVPTPCSCRRTRTRCTPRPMWRTWSLSGPATTPAWLHRGDVRHGLDHRASGRRRTERHVDADRLGQRRDAHRLPVGMNNVDVAGQTAATFTATMDSTRAGIYTVVVSQASGPSIVSTPFTVTLGTSTNNGGGSTGGGSTGGGSPGGSSSGGGGGGAFGLWFVAALAALGLGRRRFATAGDSECLRRNAHAFSRGRPAHRADLRNKTRARHLAGAGSVLGRGRTSV
jgi:GH35 family endo-1,4-beta-xylanase